MPFHGSTAVPLTCLADLEAGNLLITKSALIPEARHHRVRRARCCGMVFTVGSQPLFVCLGADVSDYICPNSSTGEKFTQRNTGGTPHWPQECSTAKENISAVSGRRNDSYPRKSHLWPLVPRQFFRDACNREANAKARYLVFVERAEKDGYASVASRFRAAARAEEIHANMFAKAIPRMGAVPGKHIEEPR